MAGYALGYLRGKELCHRGFFHIWLACILEARGVVDQQARCFDLSCHLRERELNCLKLCNRFAELLALLRVACRMAPCAFGQSKHLRADADAPLIQRFNRDFVALACVA